LTFRDGGNVFSCSVCSAYSQYVLRLFW